MKTPLKWVGGKGRIIKKMLDYIDLSDIDTIVEPFCGSCAFTFFVEPPHAILSDVNEHLINFWKCLQKNWKLLNERFEEIVNKHSKETFYEVRSALNEGKVPHFTRAAMFLYLNKAAYNGIWRVNKKGKINSSWGNYDRIYGVNEKMLEKASKLISRYEFKRADYADMLESVPTSRNVLIYLDPPYDRQYSKYEKNWEGDFSHEKLSTYFKILKRFEATVVMTNSDTPLIRALYYDARIIEIEEYRCISQKVKSRGYEKQLLIM
ncbi:MAG: DNA adenine methylase [Candidatus Helarchaeales archaeon]